MSAARGSAAGARRPLAWRLGLLLGIVVFGVLLVVGVVVNRVVSTNYQAVLTSQQQVRLGDLSTTVADRIDRPAALQVVVRKLSILLGGEVRITAADGTVLADFGTPPAGNSARLQVPVAAADGSALATLQATIPAQAADRGFLTLFNLVLLVGGLLSVIGIALASTWIANRLTRPIREVAFAARRIEAGQSGVRATGGEDRESAELADAFNAMAARLEQSEGLRRRAASDIAHDLATPATVLVGQLQAMLDGVVPADQAGLEAARSAAAALADLVGDLNDLAGAEAAPVSSHPGAVDVAALVREVVRALDGLARERRVGLVADDAPASAVAWADAGHLSRAIRNVVANAITHGPAGAPVTVSAATDGVTVRIRVADHGSGILPGDLPHIFERFYRADRSRTPDPSTGRRRGSGLGLTIAREFLAADGGRISVEQTGPDGTTFLLEVPAAGRAAG